MLKSRHLVVALLIACCFLTEGALKPNDVCKPVGDPRARKHTSTPLPSHESSTSDCTTPPSLLSMDEKKALTIQFVHKQMEAWGIPGVALSVVVQNETVLSMGLGTKEVKRVVNL